MDIALLDQFLGIHRDPVLFVELHGQFDGGDGGETDVSKHGGHAEIFRADDAGHDLVQFLLEDVHRHMAFLHGFRFFLGFREGFLVDLLVLVERDRLNLHRDGRHHIGRFLVHDEVVQRLDVNRLVCHDIRGDELAATFLFESLHGGVFDAGELADDALHLLELDTEATDFHLAVLAPHKLDIA